MCFSLITEIIKNAESQPGFCVIITTGSSVDLYSAFIWSSVKARWHRSLKKKFFPLDYATKTAGSGDNERV